MGNSEAGKVKGEVRWRPNIGDDSGDDQSGSSANGERGQSPDDREGG